MSITFTVQMDTYLTWKASTDLTLAPDFQLIGDRGTTIRLPFAPLPVELTGLAGVWQQLTRPGRLPLLLQSEPTLPVLKFTLTLAHPDREEPVEGWCDALRDAATSGERFVLSYGPQERGLWHITDLGLHLAARQPSTNQVTQATADLTLTRTSDVVGVGPLTGGAGGAAGGGTVLPPPPVRRTYTVVRGDTLWDIAHRLLGNPLLWTGLADRNHISNPRLLQIGTVLTL